MLSHKVDLRGSTNVTSPHAIRAPPTISLFHDLVQTHQNENEKSRSVHPMLMYTMASIKVPAWSALIFSRCPSPSRPPARGVEMATGKSQTDTLSSNGSLTLTVARGCVLWSDKKSNEERCSYSTNQINLKSKYYRGCWHMTCPLLALDERI